MVNLFINIYCDKNKERNLELIKCFNKNEDNPAIDKMYVFIQGHGASRKKVAFQSIENRPTFADYFNLINTVTSDNDINIIANSDIYFDAENIEQIKNNIQKHECYALARWDIYFDGKPQHFNRRDTADVWIFKGKIKEISDCDFNLGLPGCDNAICERIQRAGYIVKNPSLDIKSYHLHLSGVRNYDRKAAANKPYLLITPHSIIEQNIVYHLID